MKVVIALLVLETVNSLYLVHPRFWNYDKINWTNYTACVNGKAQSPINIVTTTTIPLPKKMHKPEFYNTKTKGPVTVWNSGRTVTINGFEQWPYLTKPYLMDETGKKFLLFRMHLHWLYSESIVGNGSEHSIDDVKHNGEIHLAFRYDDDEMDLGEALESGNVRMVSVFFDVKQRRDHQLFVMTDLDYALTLITKYDDMSEMVQFSVDPILKNVNGGMFIYNGSLTTPNCKEGIRWYVTKVPVAVAQYQMELLKHIKHVDNSRNSRPQQDVNDRIIYNV
uniref:Carbonic anhydrase n=1 Tax=Panagrellus redivivus TaxID=6233 RepID=A0A7E4UUM7_PANRE